MRVLVTGALGSGGSFLVDYLNTLPQTEVSKVMSTGRWRTAHPSRDFSQQNYYECDLMDFSSVRRMLAETRPEVIFHLASFANVKASFENPLSVVENNIRSTLNLLEAIRDLDLGVKFIMCSTSEVYGAVSDDEIPIKESSGLRPVSPYAASKAAQEMLCSAYSRSYGLEIVITRMFSYFNPRRSDLFATSFATQIVQIELGLRSELVHGNLDSIRTMIDIRDAMESYWLIAKHGKAGETYNLGGVNKVTVGDVLRSLILTSKVEVSTRLDKSLLRPKDVTLQIPDIKKFLNLTDWKPKFTLQDSIEHLLIETRRRLKSASIKP